VLYPHKTDPFQDEENKFCWLVVSSQIYKTASMLVLESKSANLPNNEN